MKPRYNLRIQSSKPIISKPNKKPSSIPLSRVTKKSKPSRGNAKINQQNRRHSLRLTSIAKEAPSTTNHHTLSKWRKVESDDDDEVEDSSINNDDNFDDLLARHQRLMLEEQKDRKLYERYVRDQRTLRRLQCRRTHTAHLTHATRTRLLRELERERRYTIQDKICSYLANHKIIFRHGYRAEPITWSALEEEASVNRNIGTIRELDVMIDNLKKVTHSSKTSISKPRLSVRERQKQRLSVNGRITPTKSDTYQSTEMKSSSIIFNPMMNLPSQLSLISLSPRVPLVRFIDDQNNKLRPSNSQHLTCIQNVLSHQNRMTTNEPSSPIGIRKSFLRQKSTHTNVSDSSSPSKKRPIEKENCSMLTNSSNANTGLTVSSPMVSIKYPSSSSSSRTYPNTRKHPMMNNSFATRRQTRLSMNA